MSSFLPPQQNQLQVGNTGFVPPRPPVGRNTGVMPPPGRNTLPVPPAPPSDTPQLPPWMNPNHGRSGPFVPVPSQQPGRGTMPPPQPSTMLPKAPARPPAPKPDPYAAARWRNEHPWLFGGGAAAPTPAPAPAPLPPIRTPPQTAMPSSPQGGPMNMQDFMTQMRPRF